LTRERLFSFPLQMRSRTSSPSRGRSPPRTTTTTTSPPHLHRLPSRPLPSYPRPPAAGKGLLGPCWSPPSPRLSPPRPRAHLADEANVAGRSEWRKKRRNFEGGTAKTRKTDGREEGDRPLLPSVFVRESAASVNSLKGLGGLEERRRDSFSSRVLSLSCEVVVAYFHATLTRGGEASDFTRIMDLSATKNYECLALPRPWLIIDVERGGGAGECGARNEGGTK